MRSTRVVALLLSAALVGAALGAPAATAKGKKKKGGPQVVGTDPADDWGANVDPAIAPLGGPLGQELVEAAIGLADKKTLNFVIKVASLPPNGGIPELTRYVWTATVDGDLIQLDGKWTNYSRGACDPTAGSCPPPRDPGMGPFSVRGNCANSGAAVLCEELGLVNAEFDASAGTITIPVPLAMINAKPGTEIAIGTQSDSGFSGVLAIPSAFFSQGNMPSDTLIIDGVFTVPGKKK